MSPGAPAPMRVVLWGTCDTGKPRVRILLDGLRANGVEVIECRSDVWAGIEDKSQVRGARRWLGLLGRVACAYPVLAWRYLRLPRHDWVLLGYPAIPDIFVVRLFAWLRGTPVAMDWFLSAYDTVVLDRRLVSRRHPLAWLLRGVEWLAVRLADRVFMDTRAHARRMEGLFGLAPGRLGSVWVGVERHAFHDTGKDGSAQATAPGSRAALRVLFYGQLIPLHGIATIVEAARLLRDEPVDWLLVGRGQDSALLAGMLASEPLPRVHWLDWVDYPDLLGHLGAADVALGIFGTSEKAGSVIPNKVFQILAAGTPLVTRDSPAARELLSHAPPRVQLVPAGDALALAAAVRALAHSDAGPKAADDDLVARFDAPAVGRQLLDFLSPSITLPTP